MRHISPDREPSALPPPPGVQWEEAACLLCGGRRWSPLMESPDWTAGDQGLRFTVVQCLECGLCFTNPRPTPASIGQFYPPAYGPHQTPRPRALRSRPLRLGRWIRNKQLQDLAGAAPGRLLDFGCGGGSYLERMHRQGWQVMGLDVSPEAVQAIHTELGLRALVGTLPHPDLQPASFDVITMWQSLEHVHDPGQVLGEARRLLVAGGKLVVAVPNISSLPFRWFRQAWFALDLPRHLTHFTPRTLDLMLRQTGFLPGPIRMVRRSNWLRSSARRACQENNPSRWQRWLKRKGLSRLAAWYCYITRRADSMVVTARS
jgi:SAM-dependent methyltransferase